MLYLISSIIYVPCLGVRFFGHFLLYIHGIKKSNDVLDFHLFAGDSSLFYFANQTIESIVSYQLSHVHKWLCANKLSQNIEKTSFVIFHRAQNRLFIN